MRRRIHGSYLRPLIHGGQTLAFDLDGLGADQHKGDDADLWSSIDPIVDGAALNKHVTSFENADHTVVEFHLDLAGDHHGVVDGVGAVVSGGHTGLIAHHSKNRAIVHRAFEGSLGGVFKAIVAHRKALGRPHHR